MSRRELAEAVNHYLWETYRQRESLTENDIGKLERGVTRWPGERRREAFRAVLHARTDAELGFYINRVMRSRPTYSTGAIAGDQHDRLYNNDLPVDPRDYDSFETGLLSATKRRMTRREVFRCLCGGFAAAALVNGCDRCGRPQRVIHALDVLLATSDDTIGQAVENLNELVSHYSRNLRIASPTSVYNELLSVRSFAGSLLERVASTDRRRSDLVSIIGWLSNFLAIVTCDMGDHTAALLWCSDAEHRGREAGNPEIAGWAIHTKVTTAFYQGQASHAISLAEQGRHITPVGSVAFARIAAQEMRAWAMLRQPDEAESARRRAAEAMASLPSGVATSGALSIHLGDDPPYTATSLLLLGRYREAVAATERVIKTTYGPGPWSRTEMPSSYARSLLILALAYAGVGQVDGAVAAGSAALESSPLVWPTKVLAGKLARSLAHDFGELAEISDYRERYINAVRQSGGRTCPG